MKTEPSPVNPGDLVAGKYRVDRILGQGGMGVVVAATHLGLREVRALKFLSVTSLTNPEWLERFRREARAVFKLKSEHVARVLDIGELPNGVPYIVMEYLEGMDLGEVLKQRGPLSLENAVLYVLQAMDAVAEAHSKGIIHRDLKPANLFITTLPSGFPCIKVLDFGISKIAKDSERDVDLTNTGAQLGSPQYMSPEQVRASRNVDLRADIWGLGVTLYRLTTGKHVFRGRTSNEIFTNMFTTQPEPPSFYVPNLPRVFDEVVLRCLRLQPDERYSTISELAQALMPLAPSGASFRLERIVGGPNLESPKSKPVDLASKIEAKDSPPSTPVAQRIGETNHAEKALVAPTSRSGDVASGEATFSSAPTLVAVRPPNHPSAGVGTEEAVLASKLTDAAIPSEFSSARTMVLDSRSNGNRSGANSHARALQSGTQSSSVEHNRRRNVQVRYIVVSCVVALVLALVMIGVVSMSK